MSASSITGPRMAPTRQSAPLAGRERRVWIERFPREAPSRYFDLKKIVTNVEEAAARSGYDWIIHNDADEIRCSPWDGLTLQQAISAVDSLGFNSIDFTTVQFTPTRDGFDDGADPEKFFTHFEFGKFPGQFVQVRAWKNTPGLNLTASLGHFARLPVQRVFPLKFLLKHYPLRSLRQAREKLFIHRAPRIPSEERGKRFIQYDLSDRARYMWDAATLLAYDPRSFPTEYLLERISGVGILRNSSYARPFSPDSTAGSTS
jgi:hypothetical protein